VLREVGLGEIVRDEIGAHGGLSVGEKGGGRGRERKRNMS
jgi:hypothetical protein